jgi:hypothetical protein
MSVFLVETYVVRGDKRGEFTPRLNEFLKYKKDHPNLFPGLKSWRLYKQQIGSPAGMYIEMWEYESLAKLEQDRTFEEDEGARRISSGFHELVDSATFSTSVWVQEAETT